MEVALPMMALVVLICIGMPIAYALGVTGAVGAAMAIGWIPTLGVLQTTPYRTAANFLLSTIPLFILMAELLARSSIVANLYRMCFLWIGHVRGGLALAAVVASTGFAALAGSSTAAAAAMARISVPEMRKYGYDDRLAVGTVAVAGTLSIMIPPSMGLIMYGVLTETSIGSLFMAGVIPGCLTAIAYATVILVWVKRRPEIAPAAPKASRQARMASILPVWPAAILVCLVLGGIYSGAITATEAAAVGAAGALVIGLGWGGLGRKEFGVALRHTLRSTAMIFAIIIGAMIFGYFLAATRAPQNLIDWVGTLPLPPWGILLVIIGIYLLLGFFIDQLAIIILTLPLTFPLVMSLGYDPIWFGIIVTKTAEIGLVTPPLGMNVFVASGAANTKVEVGFKGVMPFLVGEVIVLGLLIALPELSLYLPGLVAY
ncbi:TRAP transporter large permease (plasmid) [Tistrella mobilis]|jgi:tripartite ATP-independent transporter DctM subunit|uniref:TRAP transporter large permease n=1 Tax=Tistrella mobilis TaxID=171437 RepID=UPI003556F355